MAITKSGWFEYHSPSHSYRCENVSFCKKIFDRFLEDCGFSLEFKRFKIYIKESPYGEWGLASGKDDYGYPYGDFFNIDGTLYDCLGAEVDMMFNIDVREKSWIGHIWLKFE